MSVQRTQFRKQTLHVDRWITDKGNFRAGPGVKKAEPSRVQGLAAEIERAENRAKFLRSPSINRIAQ